MDLELALYSVGILLVIARFVPNKDSSNVVCPEACKVELWTQTMVLLSRHLINQTSHFPSLASGS